MKTKVVAAGTGLALVFAIGILAALLPGSASGHSGSGAISCTAVTFSYVDFAADKTNTVTEAVTIDGAGVYAGSFSFTGASGSHTVAITVPQDGAGHVVVASASWDTNGHVGSFRNEATVECGEPPTTTTETTPPPPGERCPPGELPTDGKDGEPGNEECEPPTSPPVPPVVTVPPATTQTTTTTTTATETTTPSPSSQPPAPKPPAAKPPKGPAVVTPPKAPRNAPPTCPPGKRFSGPCGVQGSG